jgi:hypothetical protein
LTYISPVTATAGTIPSSYYAYNGVLPTSTATGKSGTTLTQPARVAVDGNNNVWVTNSNNNSIAEASFNSSTNAISFLTPGYGANPVISGTTTQVGSNAAGAYGIGFIHYLSVPTGLAIDSSGNVWIANQSNNGNTYTSSNGSKPFTGFSTTVIVGAAGPVITPKALAVKYSKIGQKP